MEQQKPSRARVWFERGLRLSERLLAVGFAHPSDRLGRLLGGLWLAGLLVYGAGLWGAFYSWGNISFDFLDWGEVTGPRYALLRDAAEKGIIPLHAANTTALRGVTDRYFSIADTPFSPQYLLLPYLETGQYLFYDTLLLYAAGFCGLVLLYRKYRLSPASFSLLFLLFNFNGYVTGHLAVGHSIWTAYFLLPFFILLALELVEKQAVGWGWVLAVSLLLLAVLLQGFFHLWLWCLMFLGLLALFNWRLIRPVFLAGLFTGLVCLPRLLPPALALGGITQEYLGGFASLTDLVAGLVVLRDPLTAVHPLTDTFPLNPWETDYYVGLLGFAFLLGMGVLQPLWRDRSKNALQVQILFACLVLAAFSIGDVFAQVVRVFTFPPLTGERVTARMFIMPLATVMALAAIFLQRELDRRKPPAWIQVLFLGAVGLVFHDLNQHLQAWRIRYLDAMVELFPKMPFDPVQHTTGNHADPTYLAMLVGGSVAALLALAFLAWRATGERRARAREQASINR
jgi:hypothetical protein